MGQPAGAVKVKRSHGFFSKTVILLAKSDYGRDGDKVLFPNTIEMEKIKTEVQFSTKWPEGMVKQKLQETFTTFNLNGR